MCAALFHDQARGMKFLRDRNAGMETFAKLEQGGPMRDLLDFGQEVIRKRHPRHRSSRLEGTMQGVRNVSELYHLGHVDSIFSC